MVPFEDDKERPASEQTPTRRLSRRWFIKFGAASAAAAGTAVLGFPDAIKETAKIFDRLATDAGNPEYPRAHAREQALIHQRQYVAENTQKTIQESLAKLQTTITESKVYPNALSDPRGELAFGVIRDLNYYYDSSQVTAANFNEEQREVFWHITFDFVGTLIKKVVEIAQADEDLGMQPKSELGFDRSLARFITDLALEVWDGPLIGKAIEAARSIGTPTEEITTSEYQRFLEYKLKTVTAPLLQDFFAQTDVFLRDFNLSPNAQNHLDVASIVGQHWLIATKQTTTDKDEESVKISARQVAKSDQLHESRFSENHGLDYKLADNFLGIIILLDQLEKEGLLTQDEGERRKILNLHQIIATVKNTCNVATYQETVREAITTIVQGSELAHLDFADAVQLYVDYGKDTTSMANLVQDPFNRPLPQNRLDFSGHNDMFLKYMRVIDEVISNQPTGPNYRNFTTFVLHSFAVTDLVTEVLSYPESPEREVLDKLIGEYADLFAEVFPEFTRVVNFSDRLDHVDYSFEDRRFFVDSISLKNYTRSWDLLQTFKNTQPEQYAKFLSLSVNKRLEIMTDLAVENGISIYQHEHQLFFKGHIESVFPQSTRYQESDLNAPSSYDWQPELGLTIWVDGQWSGAQVATLRGNQVQIGLELFNPRELVDPNHTIEPSDREQYYAAIAFALPDVEFVAFATHEEMRLVSMDEALNLPADNIGVLRKIDPDAPNHNEAGAKLDSQYCRAIVYFRHNQLVGTALLPPFVDISKELIAYHKRVLGQADEGELTAYYAGTQATTFQVMSAGEKITALEDLTLSDSIRPENLSEYQELKELGQSPMSFKVWLKTADIP